MESIIEALSSRLKSPLPGADAHQKMIPTMRSGQRINFRNQKRPRNSAVLMLLFPKSDGLYFPLIQRPTYEGVHSGQVAFPGGKREESDPDLIHTALRETHEEIGVPHDSVRVIGTMSEFLVSASNHLILPVVGYCDHIPSYIPDPREVAEVVEGSLNELLNPANLKEKEITTTHGYKLQSPYFEIGNKVVWGATAMMLSEFVHIMEEINE